MFLGQAISWSRSVPLLHDKWLSFIPSPAAPRTNGIWHFIRGGPQPVLWFHPKKHHSRLVNIHLDIRRLHRGQSRTLEARRGSSATRTPFLAFLSEESLCLLTLGLLQHPGAGGCCEASPRLYSKLSLIRKWKLKTEGDESSGR